MNGNNIDLRKLWLEDKMSTNYTEWLENKILKLEQQKAEFIEFIKRMNDLGKLNPDRLCEHSDTIYLMSMDLLNKYEVKE